jgi:hypothetical protein
MRLSPCRLELSGTDTTESNEKYTHILDLELLEGGSVVGKSGDSAIKDGTWDPEGNVRSFALWPVPPAPGSALPARLAALSFWAGELLARVQISFELLYPDRNVYRYEGRIAAERFEGRYNECPIPCI